MMVEVCVVDRSHHRNDGVLWRIIVKFHICLHNYPGSSVPMQFSVEQPAYYMSHNEVFAPYSYPVED